MSPERRGVEVRPKVLMVDDEETVRKLLSDFLTDEGYDVTAMEDGEEALRKVHEDNFMAVLVDLKMGGGLNGIDFLRTVKQANASLPVILVTGYASLETAISATKYDAYDYIIKPFDLNEIKMVVKKAVRKYRLEVGKRKKLRILKQKKTKLERDAEELMRSKEKLERANRELKRTYKQLTKSERLAAIGQLAMGAAHQLRNPLGVISVGIHNLKNEREGMGLQERKQIALIERQLDHAGRIINDLLSFAGKTAGKITELDLNLILDDTLSVIADRASLTQVRVMKKFASRLLKMEGDAARLGQAFLNIMVNALESMPEGGMLTVGTGNLKGKRLVEVRIADTGQGIVPDNLRRIFDPFFTTKDEGIGLGLSIAYGIIDRHDGDIELKSRLGEGTSFIIRLPVGRHGENGEEKN